MNNYYLIDITKINFFKNQCELKYLIKKDTLKFIAWRIKGSNRWYLIDYSTSINAYEIGMIGISAFDTLCVHYYEIFREFKAPIIEKFLHIESEINDLHYIHSDDDYCKAFEEWIKTNNYILI